MNDATDPLKELKHALDTLSPRHLAAWTEWLETRLTERLRQRQEHRRLSARHEAPACPGPFTKEESDDA